MFDMLISGREFVLIFDVHSAVSLGHQMLCISAPALQSDVHIGCRCHWPGADGVTKPKLRGRRFSSLEPGRTSLGAYLESCGAVWGDAYEVEPVQLADEGRRCSWRVAMPAERLASLRPGDMLESPTFTLPGGCRGRFQLFPKGETDEMEPGHCSLWLCADAPVLENIRLRLGSVEAPRGSPTFCRLEDALQSDVMNLSLELDTAEAAAQAPPEVEQRLLINDLQYAEWQLFQAGRIDEKARVNGSGFVSSPPFRFHHVLLGDMYLELIPDVPNKDLCAVMFRCRVPGLSMKVSLSIGGQ
eukprot:s457_g12.t1